MRNFHFDYLRLSSSKIGGDVKIVSGELDNFNGSYEESKLKYVLEEYLKEGFTQVECMNFFPIVQKILQFEKRIDPLFIHQLKAEFKDYQENQMISFKKFFVFLFRFFYEHDIVSHRKILEIFIPSRFHSQTLSELINEFGIVFHSSQEKILSLLNNSLKDFVDLVFGERLVVYKSQISHLAINESVIGGNLIIGVKESWEDFYFPPDSKLTIDSIDARRVQVHGNFTIDQCKVTAKTQLSEKYPSTINIERATISKSLKIKNISIRKQMSLYHSNIGMELVLENVNWRVAGKKRFYLRRMIDDVDHLLELSNATCCSFYNNLLKIYETNGLKAFHKNQEKSPDKNQKKRPIMSNGFQYEIMYVDDSAMPELKSVLGFLKLCEYSPHTYIQAAKSYLRFGSDANYNKVLFEMNLEEYRQLDWRVPWFRFKSFPNREKIFGFFKRYSCGWGFHKIMIPFWLCFLGLVGTLCRVCGSDISQVSVEKVLGSMAFSLYQMIPLTFDFFEKTDNITNVYLQFYWIFHKVAGFVLLSLLLAAVSGLLGQVKKAEEFKQ